jgi:phosphoserine aminotransferase
MHNTGPTFPIYMVNEVAKYLLQTGGIKAWE